MIHSLRFARTSDIAFELGITALHDRSFVVRYRACGLLAFSQRRDALPALRPLLKHRDPRTAADATAAIDAIKRRNHHYFIDREHTGQIFWRVEGAEGAA